jgi:hypothetical protein
MAALAAAVPYISAAGTILSTVSSISGGRSDDAAARFQAKQMEQQAGQERAASQREAIEERRKARFAESRALAVSAASGAGASDPTVLDIMGDLESEGEYRALTALFNGEERARGLEMGASAKRYEGATAKRSGYMKAGSTILGGGYSLLEKYGDTTLPWQRPGNVRPGGGYY